MNSNNVETGLERSKRLRAIFEKHKDKKGSKQLSKEVEQVIRGTYKKMGFPEDGMRRQTALTKQFGRLYAQFEERKRKMLKDGEMRRMFHDMNR